MTDSGASPPNDSPLQSLVAACIEAHGRDGDGAVEAVLQRHPSLESAARAQLRQLQRAGLLDAAPAAIASRQEGRPIPPTAHSIGPYRILEPLGHGGMGTVFLAEQREPVRRRVALKLIKVGLDTREVTARFAAERQALAMMNHANIAKVLDAGSTDDGMPYFVMEYVAGLPITEYCDRQQFGSKQRLAVFLAACDGVQHAHVKGIIHRDLKPSNILVAEQDGAPQPKIIDFGVAKAIGPRLTEATLHTHAGMVVGTPEYMSPEQAGRDALDVDTRTDVYALGVLLYELLTGHLPFESARLRTDWVEMQRILREEDPKTPSQRVRTATGTAAQAAKRRATDVISLQRELRGDLDWICLKALEKDRERRYATVNDLAADVRRHLASEPVLASPPSAWYRAQKFVRRNRLQVVAGSVVALALIGGLAASLVYSRRAHAAALVAQTALQGESAARTAAEANFERAIAAVDQLLLRVAESKLGEVPQMEATRKALLSDALAFYQDLLRERQGDPRTRFEAARTKITVADLSNQLGETRAAQSAAEDAAATLSALAETEPDRPLIRVRLAQALKVQAAARTASGDIDGACTLLDRAVHELEQILRSQPNLGAVRMTLASTLLARSQVLDRRDQERALVDCRAAVEHATRAVADGADDAGDCAARCRLGLYGALSNLGRVAEAEPEMEALRDELRALRGSAKMTPARRETLAQTLAYLFPNYFARGQYSDAENVVRDEIAVRQEMLAEQPHTPHRRALLATCHANLGIVLSANEQDGADEQFAAGVRLLEELVADVPLPAYRAKLAMQCRNLALHQIQASSLVGLRAARPYATRAVAMYEPLAAQDTVSYAAHLASARAVLANILRQLGDFGAAAPIVEAALHDAETLVAKNTDTRTLETLTEAACSAAELSMVSGDLVQARQRIELGLTSIRRLLANSDDPNVQRPLHYTLQRQLGLCLALAGEHAAAADSVAELLTLGVGDRRVEVSAGDVLRLAWQAAGKQGSAAAAGYADRARHHYDAAIHALDAEMQANADVEVLAYHRACAQLGRYELERGERDDGKLVVTLAEALAVLRQEFEHSGVAPAVAAQVRDGFIWLAEAKLTAQDCKAARAAAQELIAISDNNAEALFRGACLLARCATAESDDAARKEDTVAAVAALHRSLDAGLDATRIVGEPLLEVVRASDPARSLVPRLAR